MDDRALRDELALQVDNLNILLSKATENLAQSASNRQNLNWGQDHDRLESILREEEERPNPFQVPVFDFEALGIDKSTIFSYATSVSVPETTAERSLLQEDTEGDIDNAGFFSYLPDDVVHYIVSFLSPVPDLLRFGRTCRSLYKIARDPSLWAHVSFADMAHFDEDVFLMLRGRWSELKSLNMSGSGISRVNVAIDAIPSQKLQDLDLSNCEGVDSMTIGTIANRWSGSLRRLVLKGSEISDSCTTFLARCKHLTHLDLSGTQISDGAIGTVLAEMSQLKCLKLVGCSYVGDQALLSIQELCPGLQELELIGCWMITADGIGHQWKCTELTTFKLSDVSEVSDQNIADLVKRCPKLESLWLPRCENIGDLTMENIQDTCTQLRELDLYNNTAICDESLTRLVSLNLKYLNVGCSGASKHGVAIVAKSFPLLEHLDISWITDVDDETFLLLLQNCPKLSDIYTVGCNQLTNESLENVSKYGKFMRYLDMGYCNLVSDAAIMKAISINNKLKIVDYFKDLIQA